MVVSVVALVDCLGAGCDGCGCSLPDSLRNNFGGDDREGDSLGIRSDGSRGNENVCGSSKDGSCSILSVGGSGSLDGGSGISLASFGLRPGDVHPIHLVLGGITSAGSSTIIVWAVKVITAETIVIATLKGSERILRTII